MGDYHALLGAQNRERTLQVHGFVDPGLHKCFNRGLAERSKSAAPKAPTKAFRPCETDSIPLIAAAVENLDALFDHESLQLVLFARFIIMIAQHCDDGQTDPYQSVQQ